MKKHLIGFTAFIAANMIIIAPLGLIVGIVVWVVIAKKA